MSDPAVPVARRRRWFLGAVLGSVVVAASGCGGATSPSPAPTVSPPADASPTATAAGTPSPDDTGGGAAPPELEILATDFAFEHPASIQAGATAISLVNDGEEEHQAQFARINDDATFEDVGAALQSQDFAAYFSLITLAGGPTGVPPDETGLTGSELTAGSYALICFIAGQDGVPHLAKGMLSQLEVTDSSTSAELPGGESDLTLQDFSFLGVESLPTGEQVVNVTNAGPQPHEAQVVRLSEGVDVDELIPMFTSTEPPSGPPPFSSVGGLAAIAPDARATMTLDLEPGEYAFLCFVPDPASGNPHVALGMVTGFSVE